MTRYIIVFSLITLCTQASVNRILIIKNDANTSSPVLLSHITDFGYQVETVEPDNITYSQLLPYNAVVISFGKNIYPVMSTNFRLTLVEYILAGHKVLIEGGEIAAITHQGDTTYNGFKTKALRIRDWLGHSGGDLLLNPQFAYSPLATFPNVLHSQYGINFTVNSDQDVTRPDLFSHMLYYYSNAQTTGVLVYPNVWSPQVIYFSFCYSSSSDMQLAKELLENCLHSLTGFVIGISGKNGLLPSDYNLKQNYPNPFNPSTDIEFHIPEESKVKLRIFSITGKTVAEFTRNLSPGVYIYRWDASGYPSGVYFCKLEAGNYTKAVKMILTR